MELENVTDFGQLCRDIHDIGIRERMSGHVYKEWSLLREHLLETLRDRTKMMLLIQDIIPLFDFYANKRNYPLAVLYDRGKHARLALRVLRELV
jgi:hypothetical protein